MLTLMYSTVKELGNIFDNFAAGKKLPVKVHKKVTYCCMNNAHMFTDDANASSVKRNTILLEMLI